MGLITRLPLKSVLALPFNLMIFPDDLRVGDILLYTSSEFTDKVIEVKTGDDVAHIEIYAGNACSWASRNGIGVDHYPFREAGLKYVRRPLGFDVDAATVYAGSVLGTPYGWGDIAETVDISNLLPGMDCSHFAAELLEHASCPQFDKNYDKRKITPRDFKLSNQSDQVWPTQQAS